MFDRPRRHERDRERHPREGEGRHGRGVGRRHHDEGGPHGRGRGRSHHEGSDPHQDFGPHSKGEGRGRGWRARRGAARYVLLDALRDGPKHGYEIIKALEGRSFGWYAPSPGTVYPTLQFLEDLGLVRAEQEADRRVYHLTDAGRAELEARAEEMAAFWAQLKGTGASNASQAEMGFLQEDLEHLAQTVWKGLKFTMKRDDPEAIRRVRQAVEQCRNEVRRIIADAASETA